MDTPKLSSSSLAAALSAAALAACAGARPAAPAPSYRDLHGVGDEIVAAGERVAIGAPVMLWFERPGYSAYAAEPRFGGEGPIGLRYRPGRDRSDSDRRTPAERPVLDRARLAALVDLLVLHYDACGTSRECFRVLQDERQLSAHFLLDVDGTLYQTLDLAEEAWHARQANPRSIGVEIAHVGCFPPGAPSPLDEWYVAEPDGIALSIPARLGDGGVRTTGFAGRPARPERVAGEVNGEIHEQHDFTPEQYESLVALAAALIELCPRIAPDAPRDARGAVRTDALSEAELAAFSGILGHHHVSPDKRDPGPAFDWERFLAAVRARVGSAGR
ncbi:MAG: peptidoglycan recognition family protein [Planctomycetota bacterium]